MTPPGESYGEACRRKADEGFPTGWRCADCALLWWPHEKVRDAQAHAAEHEHVIYIGPAPMRVLA